MASSVRHGIIPPLGPVHPEIMSANGRTLWHDVSMPAHDLPIGVGPLDPGEELVPLPNGFVVRREFTGLAYDEKRCLSCLFDLKVLDGEAQVLQMTITSANSDPIRREVLSRM